MRVFTAFCLLLISLNSFGQLGGDNTYEFLNLNTSARVASLGSAAIAVKDDDPFLAAENPSLLNKSMSNKLALSYVDYLADINYGFASFTKHFDSLGTFNLGIKYIDYGSFKETDIAGNDMGTFTAGEYAFIAGYGRNLDSNFSVGLNVKTIYSNLYQNKSLGLAADFGFTYYNEKRQIVLALLSKNMGRQLSSYTEGNNEPLPFEIQMGISKRLEKVPLRVSIIAQQLQQWNLLYTNPIDEQKNQSILGDESNTSSKSEDGFLENLARHMIFNAEFLISKNFNVRVGYNYLRRTELKIDEKLGTVGISWGFGVRVSKFHLSYARSAYHQAGSTNTFSISTKISDFIN